jgi:alpha-N-arabinofuranosidase
VVQQRALMDAFDPERKIGLIVDEWGTWHRPTPGRPPRGLWQQNTLRDALVAAITLDIFNRHADKVVMANIAQTVNVLQALILAENGQAIATPTYHVYDLYQGHQGATALRTSVEADDISFQYDGAQRALPAFSASASIRGRTLTLTVVNARLGAPAEATIRLHGDASVQSATETVLTHSDMRAHNTFDQPDTVRLSDPRAVGLSGRSFTHTFAPQSITRLECAL